MEPHVIVAISLMLALVILCVVPVVKTGAAQALQFWGVSFGSFGIIFGAMGTYFFTQKEVAAARTQAAAYRATASQAGMALLDFSSAVASKPDDARVIDLKNDPRYKAASEKYTDLEPAIQMMWQENKKDQQRPPK